MDCKGFDATLGSYVSVSFSFPQVKQRADECILALDKLTQINSGTPVHNVLQTQFDWTTLEVTLTSSHSEKHEVRQRDEASGGSCRGTSAGAVVRVPDYIR